MHCPKLFAQKPHCSLPDCFTSLLKYNTHCLLHLNFISGFETYNNNCPLILTCITKNIVWKYFQSNIKGKMDYNGNPLIYNIHLSLVI